MLSQEQKQKYSRMLNNLLDVKSRDKSLFTKVDNTSFFDVAIKFGTNTAEKLMSQKSYNMSLTESDLEKLVELIKRSENLEQAYSFFDLVKEPLSGLKKAELNKIPFFDKAKEMLISLVEEKRQKQKSRWMSFIRKTVDLNIQENIWPLHLATMFVSLKSATKTLYGPLLIKEVSLSFRGSSLVISEQSDWKINEKLVFMLNANGYGWDDSITLDELDGYEAIAKVVEEYALVDSNNRYEDEKFNIKPFKNLNSDEIKNSNIDFHSGLVLGLFQPSGGTLRKTMIEIIEKDAIDDLLDSEISKEKYEKTIDEFISSENNKLIGVQRTNFSQDKALISSLNQDTIIWGPPGTGKSQVIANIIANLLYLEKTAVVMSQKKAALDVLKKRMGRLAKFNLFLLNDNHMDKEEFYKPLQELIKGLEKAHSITTKEVGKPIITTTETKVIGYIKTLKEKGLYDSYIKLLSVLPKHDQNKYEVILETIKKIDPTIEQLPEGDINLENIAKINNIIKKGLLIKKYPKKVRKSIKPIIELKQLCSDIDYTNVLKNSYEVDVQKFIYLINKHTSFSSHKKTFADDEKELEKLLFKRLDIKTRGWKESNKVLYKEFESFASAVRAGRSLPYKLLDKYKKILKMLFPIIITTPQTTFIDWKEKSFDYAILDESSQIFIEIGLPILYIAKKHILAGDTQQMKPTRWFSVRDASEEDEDLTEDADSLLDYGIERGMYQVMLDKNYRSSYSSLMSFSSREFYNSKLDVADTNGNVDLPIEVINAEGKWVDSTNPIEADAVIKSIYANKDKFESIIVLTFNIKQREFIEDLIIQSHSELFNMIEQDKLVLRNIENIQGDEADLVIASLVYDPTTNMGMTYVSRPGGRNALNVAISRARDKMIIIKSITAENVRPSKSEDFITFKKWLEFLDLKEELKKRYSLGQAAVTQEIEIDEAQLIESFENIRNDVIEELSKQINLDNFDLIKDFEVGSKTIDIGIVYKPDNTFVIGLMIDNYKYNYRDGYQKYLDSISQKDFIKAKGYELFDIKEIDWYLSKENVIEKIKSLF